MNNFKWFGEKNNLKNQAIVYLVQKIIMFKK